MPCTTGTCRLPSSYAAPSGTSAAAANLNRLYGASPNISPTRERRLGGTNPRVARTRAVTRDGNLNSRLRPRTARPVSAPVQGLPTQAPTPRTAVAAPRAPLPAAGSHFPAPAPVGPLWEGHWGPLTARWRLPKPMGLGQASPKRLLMAVGSVLAPGVGPLLGPRSAVRSRVHLARSRVASWEVSWAVKLVACWGTHWAGFCPIANPPPLMVMLPWLRWFLAKPLSTPPSPVVKAMAWLISSVL